MRKLAFLLILTTGLLPGQETKNTVTAQAEEALKKLIARGFTEAEALKILESRG